MPGGNRQMHISLRTRLSIFAVVLIIATVASFVSFQMLRRTYDQLSRTLGQDVPQLIAVQEIRWRTDALRYAVNGYLLMPAGATSSQQAAQRSTIDTSIQDLTAAETKHPELAHDPLWQFAAIKERTTTFIGQANETVRLRSQNIAPASFAAQTQQFNADFAALNGTLQSAIDAKAGQFNTLQSSTREQSRRLTFLAIGSSIFAAVILPVVGLLLLLSVSRSLRQLREEAGRFANGDLSRRIATRDNDEVGQLATTFNQMAERLKTSYQRLALENSRDEVLFESMGEGLIATDKAGKITLINDNARAILDLIGTDVDDQPVTKVVNLYDNEKLVHADKRIEHHVLHTKKPQASIFSFHKKEGKPIMVNLDVNPIMVGGELSGIVMVIRDVTHEREVDRMKTEFISLASHQLRTPLSAIKWFSEMLVSGDAGKLKPEQLDFAQNIYTSSERMIELVNSLLNISRIESGRIIIDPRPTDLSELVKGIINDLGPKIEEKQHTLVVSVHKNLQKINLDPHLVGQVYLNLLTNAIKYTPKGGEISVFVSRKGDQVVSQITDNGYGIPKAQQDKVFQKFFRAENAVKVETDGTGLGLYLIKAVVESSGGKIWFESAEGKGTTFWFSLPLSGMKAKAGEVTLDA